MCCCGSLVTLLIYKVLKRASCSLTAHSSLVTLLIYKVLKHEEAAKATLEV